MYIYTHVQIKVCIYIYIYKLHTYFLYTVHTIHSSLTPQTTQLIGKYASPMECLGYIGIQDLFGVVVSSVLLKSHQFQRFRLFISISVWRKC